MRRAHFLAPSSPSSISGWRPLPPPAPRPGPKPMTAASPASSSAGLTGAIDPAAASLPLRHAALPPSGAVETELTDWRQANAAVAEFPNGHVDILRWEAAQAGRSTPAPSPHGSHMQHGGRP